MRKNNHKIIVCIILIIALCVGLTALGIFLFKDTNATPQTNNSVQNTNTPQVTKTEIIEMVKQTPYVAETCYNGASVVDPYLYETPFQKTNKYISNKRLIEKMGEGFLDDKTSLACEYVKCLYDINSNDIIADPNTFINTFSSYFDETVTFSTDEADVTREYYAESLADKYVKNKAQIDANFITDKSLVFYDNGVVYVRGYIEYTVNAYTDLEEIRIELRNPELTLGTTYYVVTHVMLVPSVKDSSQYKILGLEF